MQPIHTTPLFDVKYQCGQQGFDLPKPVPGRFIKMELLRKVTIDKSDNKCAMPSWVGVAAAGAPS